MPSAPIASLIARASARSTGVLNATSGCPSSAPATVPEAMTAMAPSTWMLCGVSTTVTSGAARSKRAPSSSMPRRVTAARSRSAGAQASAIAIPPCGAMQPKTRPTAATLARRDDRLAGRERRHQRRDLSGPARRRLHVVRAEREREQVHLTERLEGQARPRIGLDRDAQIVRDRRGRRRADGRVRSSPSAIGLGGVDLPLTRGLHAAGPGQPLHVLAVDLAPDALGPPRREALEERFRIEALADAIDPAPAQRGVHGLRVRHGGLARALLVDAQPDLRLARMVGVQPRLERTIAPECFDLLRVHDHRRH